MLPSEGCWYSPYREGRICYLDRGLAMSCQITLNGRAETVSEGITLLQLLEDKGVNPARVAVELNRRILPRDEYASTRLKSGDVIEVVTFVGGG